MSMIQYAEDLQLKKLVESIVTSLSLKHIKLDRIHCIRSRGSKSRNIIARCHALPKVMQRAASIPAFYVIEVLHEKYERTSQEEQIKTLIHELMHIPKSFGGGFIHHSQMHGSKVNALYKKYLAAQRFAEGKDLNTRVA